MFYKILKILLVLDLVAVNVAIGYTIYKFSRNTSLVVDTTSPPNLGGEKEVVYVDKCGDGCVAEIKNQIANLQIKDQKIVVVTPTAVPLVKKKLAKKEEVLTIPGTGSTVSNDWANLAGTEFYFDTRDWPGIVEVYFEAQVRLINGNGMAYVRLFDVTNGIGVTGSENNTASQSDVWTKSQKVNFWAGKNLIRVQAKSLTADTAAYAQGRLRIVVEK